MTHDQLVSLSERQYGKAIICANCEQPGIHDGHDWCRRCARRWRRAGRPADGPPPYRTRRWDEYAELTREMGHTLRQAAERMGITERTAWRYEARLRATETAADAQGAA